MYVDACPTSGSYLESLLFPSEKPEAEFFDGLRGEKSIPGIA